MNDSILSTILSRFEATTEQEVWQLESTAALPGAPPADAALYYALRVSHCVPRLKNLDTLASRWGVAQKGAGGSGLDAAAGSPHWQEVNDFLVILYLTRFDAIAEELVKRTEEKVQSLTDHARGVRVLDRAIEELKDDTAAFRSPPAGLQDRANRWIATLTALRESVNPNPNAAPSQSPTAPPEAANTASSATSVQSGRVLQIELAHTPVVCFAMEHVGVPIVHHVRIRSRSPETLLGLTLEIALAPGLIEPTPVPIPALRSGEDTTIGPVDLRLPPGRLREVLEAERARLKWRVLDGGRELLTGDEGVEILAYNEWPGSRAPGALLASFVTPNHPVVGRILQRVRDRLLTESGDGGISGYQSKSGKRVIEQVRALYGAVQDLGLTYVGLPASFEQGGQKIRLPDVLLDAQMGNCLDISVLFASCLEQMGLAPIIVIIQGHAFPGVWTVDDRFPEGIVPDVARLRNQMELHQILAFDSSTCVAAGRPGLEAAIEIARRHIAEDGRFVWAMDVRTARTDRYLPLPIRMSVVLGSEEASGKDDTPGLAETIVEEAFEVPESEPTAIEPSGLPDTVDTRFRAWKDRLLDLTLHNRLLNFRPGTGQSIPLDVPTIADFEDMLAGGDRFQILPKPPRDERDARSSDLSRARDESNQVRGQLVADLRNKRLHARHAEAELFARARELVRQARTDLEEGGATTTYAAIGILKWYESPSSEMARFAPLLLVPVQIEYEPRTQRVLLRRSEDETVGNVTLAEKMRRDFSLDLGALLALEPDETGVDVPGLLRSVRAGIQRMPRWEVVEDAYVGHFTFAKFLMWKDLEDNSETLLENHVVRHIAEGGREPFPDPVGELSTATLDEALTPAELPAVVDADSTQLAAVASAMRGRSFVLEGPPGTGKSQTITNLIAAALSAGKTVLFVSEKMAALDVVHRRLEQVGLGDYCLELHSNKANKKQVLESLGRSYERARTGGGGDWAERSTRVQSLRTELNRYAQALHRAHPIGLSFYRASSRVLELKDSAKIEVPLSSGIGITREELRDGLDRVDPMVITARRVEPVSTHPWNASKLQEWSGALQTRVEDALRKALAAIAKAEDSAKALGDLVGIAPPQNLDRMVLIADFASTAAAGRIPRIAWSESAWPEIARRAQDWSDLADRDRKEREETARRWNEGIYELDLDLIHAHLSKHSRSNALVAWFGLRSVRAQLKTLAKAALPHRSVITKDIERVLGCLKRRDPLAENQRRLQADLAGTWASPGSVEDLCGLTKRSATAPVLAARLKLEGIPVPDRIVFESEAGQTPASLGAVAAEAIASVQKLQLALRTLSDLAQIGSELPADNAESQFLAGAGMVQAWQGALPKLRDWCIYSRACAQLESAGLQELVTAHRKGLVRAGQLRQSLERSLLEQWVGLMRDSEPVLRDFSGEVHTDLVAQFGREDRGHLLAARGEVTRRLDARRPAVMTEPTSGSEASTLLGQVRLQRRHMAIRKLFDRIPNLLPRLKPCILMSPLSVAQYLPATGRRFDVVVFDEASQIGTHDAIGAIGRGEVPVHGLSIMRAGSGALRSVAAQTCSR